MVNDFYLQYVRLSKLEQEIFRVSQQKRTLLV